MGKFTAFSQNWGTKESTLSFPMKTHLTGVVKQLPPKIIPKKEFLVPAFPQHWENFPLKSQLGILKSFL